MKRFIMAGILFTMLILGSVKTSYAMDVEDARRLYYREFREDFREIKEVYGDWKLHNTEVGFVLIFEDEEESKYQIIEYDFEECKCTAWDWEFEKEEWGFDWKLLLLEKAYDL